MAGSIILACGCCGSGGSVSACSCPHGVPGELFVHFIDAVGGSTGSLAALVGTVVPIYYSSVTDPRWGNSTWCSGTFTVGGNTYTYCGTCLLTYWACALTSPGAGSVEGDSISNPGCGPPFITSGQFPNPGPAGTGALSGSVGYTILTVP